MGWVGRRRRSIHVCWDGVAAGRVVVRVGLPMPGCEVLIGVSMLGYKVARGAQDVVVLLWICSGLGGCFAVCGRMRCV